MLNRKVFQVCPDAGVRVLMSVLQAPQMVASTVIVLMQSQLPLVIFFLYQGFKHGNATNKAVPLPGVPDLAAL